MINHPDVRRLFCAPPGPPQARKPVRWQSGVPGRHIDARGRTRDRTAADLGEIAAGRLTATLRDLDPLLFSRVVAG